MKKVFIFICILTMGAFFSGCGIFEKDVTITSITAYGDKTEFDESFKLSDINVKVTKSDGTNEVVPLTAAMLSEEELAKFQTTGQHTVKVAYLGVETTFEIKIVGEKGADGREVELQVADGYIKWRYKGTSDWTNLVSLSLLSGSNGTNGKEVELQIVDEYIKWRYKGEETWVNLIQVSSLKGLKGEDGTDGKEVEIQVNEGLIEWRYKGDSTWAKLIEISKLMGPKGEDGSEVELQVNDNYIQYKQKNATVWTNLIQLSVLTGLKGEDGADGKEVELQVNDDLIEWRYKGDTTWTKLIEVAELKGSQGEDGANGKEVELQVNEGLIEWRYKGDTTWTKLIEVDTLTGQQGEAGADGKEVELQVSGDLIEWRYKGDLTWVKLIEISKLMGPKGADGSEVELQLNDNFIQYKLKNATVWTNLISLDLIRGVPGPIGPEGPTPLIEISEDGYWVINGFKTTTRAAVITPEVQKYTVTFDANDGVFPEGFNNVMENVVEGSIIDLPIPTHENLTFIGWYIGDEPHNQAFDEFDTVHKNMTLIARWDYTILNLEKFLDITRLGNYSLDYYRKILINEEHNQTMTNVNYSLDSNGVLNVYENYLYEDLTDIYEYKDYYLYTEKSNYNLSYYDEMWHFYKSDSDEYTQYIDLSKLQLNKFVRQNESHIYKYPNSTELLDAIDLDYSKEFFNDIIYSGSYAYVDLKEMKFVINFEFYEEDDLGSYYQEFTFFDIGTTVALFPIEDVKNTIINELSNYLDRDGYKYATEECKAAFLARYNEMISRITNEDDKDILFDLSEAFYDELNYFPFVQNELVYMREIYIDDLTRFFNGECEYATEESIVDMRAILEAAIAQINSVTILEAQSVVHYAKMDIYGAFKEDEFKVQLQEYKYEIYNMYSELADSLNFLLVDSNQPYDSLEFYDLQLVEAKTYEEVDAVAELLENYFNFELIYDVNNLHNFQNDYTNQIHYFYADGINGFSSYPQEIWDKLIESYDALYNTNTYFETIEVYNSYMDILNQMILQYNKDYYLNILETAHSSKMQVVVDDKIEAIVLLYNKCKDLINYEEDFNNPQIYFNSYFNELMSIAINPVKVEIPKKLNELLKSFNSLILTSNAESIIQITSIYENTIELIMDSETLLDLSNNLENGKSNMKLASVIDEDKKALVDYKAETYYKMNNLCILVNKNVDNYYQYRITDLLSQYTAMINEFQTFEELDTLYLTLYEELLNINVVINIDTFVINRNALVSEISNIIDFITENYADTQADYLHALEDALEMIDNNYHPVKVINAYLNLGDNPTNHVKVINNDNLASIFSHYLEIVHADVQTELYTRYHGFYKVNLNNAIDYLAQYQVILTFKSYVETLPLA